MKAFLIARVSTLEQSDALPGQVYRLKDYASRKAFDYELFEIKESAYKSHRSSFNQVIEKVQKHSEPSVIVFDKIDRYTRDSNSDEVSILNNLCRSGQIEIHFPSDSLFISKNSSAQEHFMLNMGVSTAQYYSDAISDNVKRRNQQKLRDGEWCGKAPIGYINTTKTDGKKWVEIDPLYSKVIRETFEEYASGNSSLREIAKKWQSRYGLKVGSSRIDQVLKNPFYYGEMKVKDKIYPHKYEPIIARQLFEQAKQIRDGYLIKPHRWGGLPYPYRGLIHCSDCGCRITFEKKKNLYIYGHCTQYKGKHNANYVNQDQLTKQLMKIFKEVRIPELAYQQVSDALHKSHNNEKKTYRDQAFAIETEIKKYQTRKEKIYEDYLDEKISEDLYTKKFEEYRTKVRLLQEHRSNIELDNNEYYESVFHLLDIAKDIPNLFKVADQEQKRSLINLILSNLQLDGEQLRWKLKKPFDTMAFCSVSSNWLRRLGSNQ